MVPALYALWDLSDRFAVGEVDVGIAVNAPFGFETEYKEEWIGRYYALQSRIKSLALNPVVSLEPVPGFALAVGAQAQYIDAKLTNAIDFGTLGALNHVAGAAPTAQDGFPKLTGAAWGFGYTAGLLLEPWPGTRIGAAYRSKISHDLEGDARVRLDSDGIGAALGGHRRHHRRAGRPDHSRNRLVRSLSRDRPRRGLSWPRRVGPAGAACAFCA